MFTKNGVASETGVAAAAAAAGTGAAAAGAGAAGAGAEADGAAGGGEVCAEAATANVTTAANPRTSFRIAILSPPSFAKAYRLFATKVQPATTCQENGAAGRLRLRRSTGLP